MFWKIEIWQILLSNWTGPSFHRERCSRGVSEPQNFVSDPSKHYRALSKSLCWTCNNRLQGLISGECFGTNFPTRNIFWPKRFQQSVQFIIYHSGQRITGCSSQTKLMWAKKIYNTLQSLRQSKAAKLDWMLICAIYDCHNFSKTGRFWHFFLHSVHFR